MKTEEHLLWILDYKNDAHSHEEEVTDKCISGSECIKRNKYIDEAVVTKNVEFVHSLGLKCDSVGWCSLDLQRPDIASLLEKINTFALEEGLCLRGYYTRELTDFDSEWYLLESKYLSNGEWNYVNVKDRNGNPLKIDEVYAYKVPRYVQALWDNKLPHVSEDMRNSCLDHRFSGVDFYWIRDIGRYNATQFFGLIIENIVPEFACDRYLSYNDSKNKNDKNNDRSVTSPLYQKYLTLGGKLPKLISMFYYLDINLPIQLPRNKMPETDFAYIYFCRDDYTEHYALIKKHAADILLSEKVIRKEYLKPVKLYDIAPEGYHIQTSETIVYPSEEVIKNLKSDYDKLKKNPKPERKALEKDALKLFRNIKKLRPEDFKKGLAKGKLETLATVSYKLLSPYYSISDGGYLSDEYRLLSYSETLKETQDFAAEIKKEELLIDSHIGIVIANSANGDTVMIDIDGSVKRISHETMDVCESWDTVAQFFFETLADS